MKLFTHDEILELIELLAQKLTEQGVTGSMSIVGGAAINISLDPSRRLTTDIDAFFSDQEIFERAAADIAQLRALPHDWINSRAIGFLPFENHDMWVTFKTFGSIEIRLGSIELLLAMKLRAARGLRDWPDIELLLLHNGITTVAAAQAVVEKFFPQEVLDSKTAERLLALLKG